jgi:hypothetical protein
MGERTLLGFKAQGLGEGTQREGEEIETIQQLHVAELHHDDLKASHQYRVGRECIVLHPIEEELAIKASGIVGNDVAAFILLLNEPLAELVERLISEPLSSPRLLTILAQSVQDLIIAQIAHLLIANTIHHVFLDLAMCIPAYNQILTRLRVEEYVTRGTITSNQGLGRFRDLLHVAQMSGGIDVLLAMLALEL